MERRSRGRRREGRERREREGERKCSMRLNVEWWSGGHPRSSARPDETREREREREGEKERERERGREGNMPPFTHQTRFHGTTGHSPPTHTLSLSLSLSHSFWFIPFLYLAIPPSLFLSLSLS